MAQSIVRNFNFNYIHAVTVVDGISIKYFVESMAHVVCGTATQVMIGCH